MNALFYTFGFKGVSPNDRELTVNLFCISNDIAIVVANLIALPLSRGKIVLLSPYQ
jgi:hypothetical protein